MFNKSLFKSHRDASADGARQVVIVETQIKQYRKRFYVELATRLRRDRIELTVLYSRAYSAELSKRDTVELGSEIGIRVPGIWLFKGRLLFQPIWNEIRDADLVITEQANKLVFNYVLLAMSKLGLKRIAFWGHGFNHQAVEPSASEWLKRRQLGLANWWFAYTSGVKQYLVGRGVDSETITVVQNTIDTQELSSAVRDLPAAARQETRQRLGISSTAQVGLFCGSLYPDKKLGFLIDAAKRIHNETRTFHLVIVGDGAERAQVEDAARKYPFVHYVGSAFGEDRAAYFAISHVFLNPGLVGLAVVDAFAAELPVITTDIPIHSPEIEYVENGVNGRITRHDPNTYADAVVQVLRDPALMRALSDGAKVAAARLTLAHMVDAFAGGIVRSLERT